MTNQKRKILVTTALPYANGHLHLGNMVENIQADIWVRFQRLRGADIHFFGGDDAHGTPIMLNAEKQGLTPEQLIANIKQSHLNDFRDFNISFDHYHSTHSPENRALACELFTKLQAGGDILKKTIEQAYDTEKQMFLPDRYVKGECPTCHAPDQYGDNCEACGATYAPTELKNPVSVISNTTPIQKQSEHLFFNLQRYHDFLQIWVRQNRLQEEVVNKLNEWLAHDLQDWCISRDAPYFGFEIPGHPNKYFYVWLDAPIGYIASTKAYCEKNHLDYLQFWGEHSDTAIYHFIGKDIIYFHTLFWPAMLHGAKFNTPTAVYVHGFLTIDGQKMSKSRGTFITVRSYLNHLPAEALRYYVAAKLNAGVVDIDLNWHDFITRVNADLVGKFVNIASRSAGFIHNQFQGQLAATLANPRLYDHFVAESKLIAEYYDNREFSKAIRAVMALADLANQYIDEQKPWVMMKDPDQKSTAQTVCTMGLNLYRLLIIFMKPIVPTLAKDSETFLNCGDLSWDDITQPLLNHAINPFKPLLQRIEGSQVQAMQTENKPPESEPQSTRTIAPIADTITIEDFAKIDLRIAKIVAAEAVAEADKLVKLQLDIGHEVRQVFAGIKKGYPNPENLVGQYTVMVANLAPRKMRFGISQGMVLAAHNESGIWILHPDLGPTPGTRVT